MQELGYNYRMSDLHASLGLSQLKRIGDFLKIRKEIVLYYIDKLKSFPLRTPPTLQTQHGIYLCVILRTAK